MRSMITLVVFMIMVCSIQSIWNAETHQIRGDASAALAAGIKAKIIANINKITNAAEAQAILSDLNLSDDASRTLKSISTATAGQLFDIFSLNNPNCDENKNGTVEGDQLGCLGKIWKNYVPQ